MSLVPMRQGVPSAANCPNGTITVSSTSVQYNSHGSSLILRLEFLYE